MRINFLYLCVAICCCVEAGVAQSVAEKIQKSAPAVVPITKEPAHHLVLENDYVRVFKVEVAPHSETKFHQHDLDYVFVTLGDSDVESVRVGETPVRLQLKDGETRFTKGGFAHKAVNNSDKPFVNVTVELKKGAGMAASCEIKSDDGLCVEQSAAGTDNSWRISKATGMRIFRIRTAPGKNFGMDSSTTGRGLIVLWKGKLSVKTRSAKFLINPDSIQWVESFRGSSFTCSIEDDCNYVVLESNAQPGAAVPHEPK
jgi:quercetin dioxygenase-like cupin family protein